MTRSWRSFLLVVALVATTGLPLVLAAAQPPPQPRRRSRCGATQAPPDDGAKPAPEKAAPAPGDLLDVDLEGPILSARTWRRFARDLFASFIAFLPALFRALIVIVAVYLFYRAVIGVLRGMMRRANADPAVHEIGLRLVRYALLGLGVIMALAQLGFDVASVLAGLGIVGLAVGLAAQETLANLIAGLTLLWDRPFRIGDNVTIADTFGQVQQIGLRTTRILTVDRLDAILPNKDVINEKIINHTLNPQLRLPVPLSIAYKEDTREARKVLLAAVAGHPDGPRRSAAAAGRHQPRRVVGRSRAAGVAQGPLQRARRPDGDARAVQDRPRRGGHRDPLPATHPPLRRRGGRGWRAAATARRLGTARRTAARARRRRGARRREPVIVERRHLEGFTLLLVEGVIKLGESAEFFVQALERALADDAGDVIVDFSRINYIDSTGIGELVGLLGRFQDRRRKLILVNPAERILRLLRVARLAELFPIYDTVEAAVAAEGGAAG